MSFANQFLALKMLHEDKERRDPTVHELPEEQDQEIGKLKLETMGIAIDEWTEEQRRYATDWKAGT